MPSPPPRKQIHLWGMILAAFLLLALALPARAQPAPAGAAPLKVGVYVVPPFVIKTPNGYGGMAIDLWQEIAAKLGLTYQYVEIPSFPDLLQAVASGQVDIGVSDITITQERLQRMDFTQPWFDSGLRVMIDQDRQARLGLILKKLYDGGHLRIYMWLGIVIIVSTIGLTLLDRRFDEEFPKKWHEGIIESLYHVLSVVTSGKSSHKLLFGIYGRLLAALWLIIGVTVVAYITSSITTVMTVVTLNDQIRSNADLDGKTVAVVEGTVAEGFCLDSGLTTQTFINLPAAVHALLGRQVAAIVGDAPTLEYFDNSHPDLPITEVGEIFQPSKYGFATPLGSKLTREVSVQIVAAMEDGTLAKLNAKYFGVEP